MRITVFTPTYNRAYILSNLYNSLKRQTFKDFEWLIVDDGSTDNTTELVSSWQQATDNGFPIRYYKKENGGKCRAINYGVDRAEGELFFNVDSDDYLTNDALEKIDRWERELPKDKKYCGLAGNLGTSETATPNTPFENQYRDDSILARYSQYSDKPIDGERAVVFYTQVQKTYKFPEFEGENFLTEAVSWNRMAKDGYIMRFFNDIIWVYEYQPDGLTASGSRSFIENPRGYGLCLKEKADFCGYSKWQKLKMYYTFYCDMSECYSKKEIAEFISAPTAVIYVAATIHGVSGLMKGKKRK